MDDFIEDVVADEIVEAAQVDMAIGYDQRLEQQAIDQVEYAQMAQEVAQDNAYQQYQIDRYEDNYLRNELIGQQVRQEETIQYNQYAENVAYNNYQAERQAEVLAENDLLAQNAWQREQAMANLQSQEIRQQQLSYAAREEEEAVAYQMGGYGLAQRENRVIQQQNMYRNQQIQDERANQMLNNQQPNYRQDNRIIREEERVIREEEREDRRQLREEKRQIRDQERGQRRFLREEGREERRQFKQQEREERRQVREEERADRHVMREEKRQVRHEDRQMREEERQFNRQVGAEIVSAERFQSPIYYHHFFEWKEGVGNNAGSELTIGDKSLRLSDLGKIKIMKQTAINKSRKIKLSHATGDILFSVQPERMIGTLPLHYFWFARLITEKMRLKGCNIDDPYVPEVTFTNSHAKTPIMDGILYKQSQYLKSWELRYVVITTEGLVSFKDDSSTESFTIKRETAQELWTRFDIHEKMLIIKVHHNSRKTEFGIPIVDYCRESDINWLYAFYRLVFPF